jgi:hypothetical protein
MHHLRRYWIQFGNPRSVRDGLGYGCGVTAYNFDDAVALVEERVFKGPLPYPIVSTLEDVDVSTLDTGHVLPNMLPPNSRGVWFPMGYD